jgi:hypothetical protein
MKRRDFLRGSGGRRRGEPLELSGERLYMSFLDCRQDGTTASLIDRLRGRLLSAGAIRVVDASWLEREELREQLQPLLDAFRARGGRIELG